MSIIITLRVNELIIFLPIDDKIVNESAWACDKVFQCHS